jgi:hypothetical protein
LDGTFELAEWWDLPLWQSDFTFAQAQELVMAGQEPRRVDCSEKDVALDLFQRTTWTSFLTNEGEQLGLPLWQSDFTFAQAQELVMAGQEVGVQITGDLPEA